MEPTRYGAHTHQDKEYPRAAYATGLTLVKSGVAHVSARYGVLTSRSKDYPRGARATGSTPVHPRTTPRSEGYIALLIGHTYRSNLVKLLLSSSPSDTLLL